MNATSKDCRHAATLEEISQHYDASIASRLAAWLPVVLNGPDRRKT